MRLVVSVVLLGLLAGCVSDDYGYYQEPLYGPAYGPVYGPVYHHAPRPYVVVPGHAHHGYRLEQRDYRGPIYRHHEPRHRPLQPPHGYRPHPPIRPQRPIVAPGYRPDDRHHQGRQHAHDGRRPAHEGRQHDTGGRRPAHDGRQSAHEGRHPSRQERPSYHQRPDRGEARGDRLQGSPRQQWGGNGPHGRGESRTYR